MRRLPFVPGRLASLGLPAVLMFALALAGYLTVGPGARAAGTEPDAFSIDMDPANAPANTATSLGSVEACARMNENGVLDADEDVAEDQLLVDVTVLNVPESNAMIGFSFSMTFPDTSVRIAAVNRNGLLSTAPGFSGFPAGEEVPDTTSPFTANMLDINAAGASGSGFLYRFTVETLPAAATGEYPLEFVDDNFLIDTVNEPHFPDALNGATLAINQACPGGPTITFTPPPSSTPTPTPSPIPTASPTPSPTGSPTPTASPTPAELQGDVDCDGDVDAVDALKILRRLATLPVIQEEGCTPIGTGDPLMGDVDCDLDVDAVDALKILRHLATLPVVQEEGCTLIGG